MNAWMELTRCDEKTITRQRLAKEIYQPKEL
jgi:hypothetical protein